MEIRTATLDDVEALVEYAGSLFAERLPGIYRRRTPTPAEEVAFIRARIEPANSTLLVAEEDGQVVGLIDFVGHDLAEEAHSGTFGLSVASGHRGRGIGSALIEALLEWAPQNGITRIECRAFATNPRAIALYERMGFVREGVCRSGVILDGEPVDVIILARLLPS